MLRRHVVPAGLAFLAGRGLLGAVYEAEIAEWRKNYDRDLRSEKGPLLLIGRYELQEGSTEIGSNAACKIALPNRAPKRVGIIERRRDNVTFQSVDGIAVTLNGKPMNGPSALRAGMAPKPGDKLAFGDFEIAISQFDGQYQLTVRDRQSEFIKQFRGAAWFPVNPAYRVETTFNSYPQPKDLRVPDTTGRTRIRQVPGYVTFQLNGEKLRLEPVAIDDILFFMFKDRTSGRETYGAGRYLEAEMPKHGKVLMDFNKAYNPYCAFSPYSSCPIPPKSNTLFTRVEAGEKYLGDH